MAEANEIKAGYERAALPPAVKFQTDPDATPVRFLLPVAIVPGVAATVYGLSNMSWPGTLPWEDTGALHRFLALLAAGFVFIALAAKVLRWTPLFCFAAVAALTAAACGVAAALAWVLIFFASACLLGRCLFQLLSVVDRGYAEDFLLGAGLYGTAIGLLAHFPVNYAGVYVLLLAAPWLMWRRRAMDLLAEWGAGIASLRAGQGGIHWLWVTVGAVAMLHFTVALLPEICHDALAVHLFVPSHLASRHQWAFDFSTYIWAVMPMLGDWIFAIGHLLAGETAARLINVGFLFVLAWQIYDLARWAGASGRGATWSVLLFLSTPLAFTESSTLFIDLVWTAYVIAGSMAVLRICAAITAAKADLAKAGLFLGFALASKAITLSILPALTLFLLVRYKSWAQAEQWGSLALGLGLMLAAGATPYITAAVLTGSPLYPYYNVWFKSPYTALRNIRDERWSEGLAWHLPYSLTFYSGRYLESRVGAAGFQWCMLGAPIVLLSLKWRRAMAIAALAMLAFAVTFTLSSYMRYVFPSFVLLAAAAGPALDLASLAQAWFRWVLFCLLTVTVILNLLFFNAGAQYGDFVLKAALSESDRSAYLLQRRPVRNAITLINQLNLEKSPVFVYADPMGAGLSGDALYANWYNAAFENEINAANTPAELAERLQARGARFIIVDKDFGNQRLRALIATASEPLQEVGNVSVRALRREYLFRKEMLKNIDFLSGGAWSNAQSAGGLKDGNAVVSEPQSSQQTVAAAAGRLYLNSVKARCKDGPTQGRLQVIWLDKNSRFLRVDAKFFDCTPEVSAHQMEVYPPDGAAFASVYTTSHSTVPMVFTENSLRE